MIFGLYGTYLTYQDYLQSDEWKEKRNLRIYMDGGKCSLCDRPIDTDLQVHHFHYKTLGHENVEDDLITLCKYCHAKIHKENIANKYSFYAYKKYIRQIEIDSKTEIFCKDYHCRDVSIGGDLNMMDKETIRTEWGSIYGDGSRAPIMDIQRYFKHIRVRVIKSMEDAGATPDEIMARGISRHMIQKYYNKPEAVERALEV